VKNEEGDLFANYHSILARWRNHFSQLLSVHGVSDVRQTEIHTAVLLVPEQCACEIEMAVGEDTKHQVLIRSQQNLLKQGVEQFAHEINKLILFGVRRNCLSSGRVIHCTYLSEG
jgi:hypothetical protein